MCLSFSLVAQIISFVLMGLFNASPAAMTTSRRRRPCLILPQRVITARRKSIISLTECRLPSAACRHKVSAATRKEEAPPLQCPAPQLINDIGSFSERTRVAVCRRHNKTQLTYKCTVSTGSTHFLFSMGITLSPNHSHVVTSA